MKSLKIAATTAALALAAGSAQASVVEFEVLSFDHMVTSTGGGGLATGINLSSGQVFSVTASPSDTWSLGANDTREINADGDSVATGAPFFGSATIAGQTFVYGQLLGRIDDGDLFLIGTNFTGAAAAAGQLFLVNWDTNGRDNSGSIFAEVSVTSVPLPASGLALLGGLFGAGAVMRRKASKA